MRALVVLLLTGCSLAHERAGSASATHDAAAVPMSCAAPYDCASASMTSPRLWYALDHDLVNRGSEPGHDGIGDAHFTTWSRGGALDLTDGSAVELSGTAGVVASAPALTFSFWSRTGGIGRTMLSCRVRDHGIEVYRGADMGVTACAGASTPDAMTWGGCSSGARCNEWTHVVVRWRGAGAAPELAVDGAGFVPLQHDGRVAAPPADLFASIGDIVLGSPATGEVQIADVRVYDVAFGDDIVWATTSCAPR